MNGWAALGISAGIVALSAFFVAVEFALVAARRNRLAEAAGTSRAARAALDSARELSLLLAGSQLGITLCTLALGAIAKPAVHHLIAPGLEAVRMPAAAADIAAFVLSLLVVTFVHLVVGEMAPKSWAIAHPEKSATLLALPMRAFMWATRPVLRVLNDLANWSLRRVGVQPVDEITTARTPADLQQLIEHSTKAGALDTPRHEQLALALDLHTRPVGQVAHPITRAATVDAAAAPDQIRATSRGSGHSRLIVTHQRQPIGVVHVRDALTASPHATARALMRPATAITGDTPIYTALQTMRTTRNHLALTTTGDQTTGLVTLQDLLDQLLNAPAAPAVRPEMDGSAERP